MRPLTLRFSGLRSYRQDTTVDFADRSLVAIIGDTGAGKSSLLEAMTYALYGASTWSKQAGDLISHATGQMQVVFDFEADGRRWTATRSMSATNYPAPVHRLECPETGEQINSRNEVNARIVALVGLDYDGFLRAVILPQGRFDRLLTAAAGDRQATLKNIFRVDQVEAVRDAATRLRDELQPKHGALVQVRASLLPDPAAEVARLQREVHEAAAAVTRLQGWQQTVQEATEHRADASRTASEVAGLLGRLPAPELVSSLAPRAARISASRVERDTAVEQATSSLAAAEAALAAAAGRLQARVDDGTDAASLATAIQAVSALPQAHEDVVAMARNLAGTRTEAVRTRAEHERLGAERATSAERLADAQEHVRQAEAELAVAQDARREAQAAVIAVLEEAERLAEATDRARGESTTLAEATQAVERTEGAAVAAGQAHDEAAEHLAAVQRADAAAHAAHGLGPGDRCPVCDRVLDDLFVPTEASGLDDAQRAMATATEGRRQAEQLAIEARARRATAETVVVAADAELARRRAAVAARLAHLGGLLVDGSPGAVPTAPPTPTVDDLRDDGAAEVLEPLARAVDTAVLGRDAARSAASELDASVAGLDAEVRARARDAARLDGEVSGLERELVNRAGRLGREVAALDVRWRPDVDPVALLAGDGWAEAATPLDVGAALGVLGRLREDLVALEAERQDAEVTRRSAQGARDEAVQRRRDEVDRPAADLRVDATTVREALGTVASGLGQAQPAPVPGDGDDLDAMRSWCERAVGTLASLRSVADHRSAAAQADVGAAEQTIADVLAAADVRSADELTDVVVAARTTRQTTGSGLLEAQRQVPQAQELDRRIAEGRAFLGAVEVVRSKLANSAFIQHLISRRQQALLGVASRILSEITNDRFGFSEDFEIFDQLSGQPRSPRTLSGGETFLASLALALAMVELAARAGGRLDALFLDEGFGALDLENLDAAVDALESRAQAGRLVAVITHVMAVAERIPDVLAVYDKEDGSHVQWLDDIQRQLAASADVDDAVSRALGGLLR